MNRRSTRHIQLHLTSLVAVIFLVVVGVGCSGDASAAGDGNGPGAAGPGGQAMPVKVQPAQLKQVADSTEYLATLRSRNSAIIQPQVEGYITRIYVQAGDRVQRGTRLLEIDPDKQQASVVNQVATRNAKRATLDYNRRELERRKQLYAAGVISRQDLDQAQSAFRAAQADVAASDASIREQREQLRYYTVKAPEPGIVGDIPVRVGDRVSVQTQLTTVDQRGELEAYISLPADKAADVRLGMPVVIYTDGSSPVRTKVTFISPRVDPDSQLLLVKTSLPNGDGRFRNAQVVRARMLWSERQMPVVPVTAVSRLGAQIFAFVVDDNGGKPVARQRPLKVGDLVDNDYVVQEGLKAGERIIISGVQMLTDGMPVQPQS
ncbi:MAG TPA: efflux RND transporter periplasmic adaptor subunit [Terriglobales bacterium]|nr:efflux RND transporter periplasmic adaptor subunit [Terriglobales bacterium]